VSSIAINSLEKKFFTSLGKVKVFKAVSADEGSLAGSEPPVRLEPRTHKLREWIIDFPSQVTRRLLKNPEHH